MEIECNFCLVNRIRVRASKRGEAVKLVKDTLMGKYPLGRTIYSSPQAVKKPEDFGYFYKVCWIASYPNLCRC